MFKVSIIGSGNVATQLGKALYRRRVRINQVYSRSLKNAEILANEIKASPIDDLKNLSTNSEIYIISIADDHIKTIVSQIDLEKSLIVHTSGSVEMNALASASENFGVFYPLQTFSKQKIVSFKNIPICIEANNETSLMKLETLGSIVSESIQFISTEQRKKIHLAAVFACNFSNSLFTIAEKILKNSELDFRILLPLIQETVHKLNELSPKEAQTGPAKRNDLNIIQNHLMQLDQHPAWQKLYQTLTDNIQKTD